MGKMAYPGSAPEADLRARPRESESRPPGRLSSSGSGAGYGPTIRPSTAADTGEWAAM